MPNSFNFENEMIHNILNFWTQQYSSLIYRNLRGIIGLALF